MPPGTHVPLPLVDHLGPRGLELNELFLGDAPLFLGGLQQAASGLEDLQPRVERAVLNPPILRIFLEVEGDGLQEAELVVPRDPGIGDHGLDFLIGAVPAEGDRVHDPTRGHDLRQTRKEHYVKERVHFFLQMPPNRLNLL